MTWQKQKNSPGMFWFHPNRQLRVAMLLDGAFSRTHWRKGAGVEGPICAQSDGHDNSSAIMVVM